ncbi:MAG: hypothetical protein V1750_10620 [Acidobacteriota bacterium]
MTAAECVQAARVAGELYQGPINELIDEFRRAAPGERRRIAAAPVESSGKIEGLVAAVISALCREVGMPVPDWVGVTGSPEPFFAFPARSYAMRVRLMLESPPPFRVRNVFVPASYLSRA